jgi:putative phage-type endonuclease
MKTQTFQNREEWLQARRGKITGTRVKDLIVLRGTGKKKGFYELIAERLAVEPDGENPMERGSRLEPEAIERFAKETGKEVDTDLVIWTRDDNESIAISPDGAIGKTEAIETKCLSSASHLEAYLTQEVPDEYKYQKIQYFVVNDKLKTLYFAFYDPRILVKDFFFLIIKREDIEDEIKASLEYQEKSLQEVDDIVNKLSNF